MQRVSRSSWSTTTDAPRNSIHSVNSACCICALRILVSGDSSRETQGSERRVSRSSYPMRRGQFREFDYHHLLHDGNYQTINWSGNGCFGLVGARHFSPDCHNSIRLWGYLEHRRQYRPNSLRCLLYRHISNPGHLHAHGNVQWRRNVRGSGYVYVGHKRNALYCGWDARLCLDFFLYQLLRCQHYIQQ